MLFAEMQEPTPHPNFEGYSIETFFGQSNSFQVGGEKGCGMMKDWTSSCHGPPVMHQLQAANAATSANFMGSSIILNSILFCIESHNGVQWHTIPMVRTTHIFGQPINSHVVAIVTSYHSLWVFHFRIIVFLTKTFKNDAYICVCMCIYKIKNNSLGHIWNTHRSSCLGNDGHLT